MTQDLITRYFKVTHKAGAFWDGVWYPPEQDAVDVMDSIVPVQLTANAKPPLWGIETDSNGIEIGEQPTHSPVEKLSDALASKIAGTPAKLAAPEDTSKEAAQRKQVILDTLDLLDHANDVHWTAAGEPKVDVVNDAAGLEFTRAEITAAAPDFKRVK